MNFTEWTKQTSRELGYGYSKEIVTKVLLMAIRVALEEFLVNPYEADLDIMGIGRFYLNYCKSRNKIKNSPSYNEYVMRWQVRFKARLQLRDLLNARKDITQMRVSGYYLYPDQIDEKLANLKLIEVKKEQEIRHTNEYWIKRIEAMKHGVLDFVNGEWVKTGFSEEDYLKEEINKKRGRPHNKLTPKQARNLVMTEISRDYKREKRHLRQGKITEKDLKYPWFSKPVKSRAFWKELERTLLKEDAIKDEFYINHINVNEWRWW